MLVGDPDAWGKGVAREAERQACVHAFKEHGVHRIHAEIPATNRAAQKVVTHLGLQARGGDAPGDSPRRRGRGQRGLGPSARGVHLGASDLTRRLSCSPTGGRRPTRTTSFAPAPSTTPRASPTRCGSVQAPRRSPCRCWSARSPTAASRTRSRRTGIRAARLVGQGGAPADPAEIDWSSTGLVSLFVRERLGGEPCLAGPTERSVVQVHDPSRPRSLRSRFAEQIRRNRKLGYGIEVAVRARDLRRAAGRLSRGVHADHAARRGGGALPVRARVLRHGPRLRALLARALSQPGGDHRGRGRSWRSRTGSFTTTSAAPPRPTWRSPRSRTWSRR